jgi:hypothetical protein
MSFEAKNNLALVIKPNLKLVNRTKIEKKTLNYRQIKQIFILIFFLTYEKTSVSFKICQL